MILQDSRAVRAFHVRHWKRETTTLIIGSENGYEDGEEDNDDETDTTPRAIHMAIHSPVPFDYFCLFMVRPIRRTALARFTRVHFGVHGQRIRFCR